MRPPRRAAAVALALVPLGTVAGHVVGYSLADRSAAFDGSHSHLRPTTWLAAVLALGAVGWVASGRDGHRARVRVGWMAAAQAALFVVMEAVEHLTAGHGITHLLAEPALRWGVGAQVVTAAALVATAMIARASGDRVRALLAGRPAGDGPAAPAAPVAPAAEVRSLTVASPATERGPPRRLASV